MMMLMMMMMMMTVVWMMTRGLFHYFLFSNSHDSIGH